jgi:hypothetical protein
LKKEDIISKKIKESFENESFKAPGFNDVVNFSSEDIDKKITSSFENVNVKAPKFSELQKNSDTIFNKKIKGSFEKERYVLPNSVWNNIENKLDVYKTWNKIVNNIYTNSFSWYRLAFVASLLIITLLIPFKFADEKMRSYLSFSGTKVTYSNKNKSLQVVSNQQVLQTNSNQLNHIDNNTLIKTEKPFNSRKLISNKINNDLFDNETLKIKNNQDKRLNNIELISLNPTPIYLNQSLNEMIEINPIENTAKKSKFSVGLFASINTSILNDEETRASFKSNNLTTYKPTLSSSKGIVADYFFNDKLSLSAYYLFQSTSKGKTAFFNGDGFYTIKTKQIDYSKYALLVNYSFNFNDGKLNTRNSFGVGPYFAVNNGSVTYQNDVITSFNSNYKKYDYGLKVALGKELIFNEFIIGGGVTSDVGLSNIINNANQFTSNFNLGLYLNVKYKL